MSAKATETTVGDEQPTTAEPMEPVDAGEEITPEEGAGYIEEPKDDSEGVYDDGIQDGDELVDSEGEVTEPPADEGDEQGEEASTEPATVEFDDEIIQVAQQLGLSEQEARSYPSVGLLERHLRAELLSRGGGTIPDQPPGQGQQVPTEPTAPRFQLPDALKEEVSPELFGAINKQFEAVQQHYDGQLVQAQQAFAQVAQRFDKQENARYVERFDSWVEGLGENYEGLLGVGPTLSMPMNSKTRQNRVKIGDETDTMKAGYEVRGKTPPSDKVLRERALRNLFGDKDKTVARKEVKAEAAARAKQAIARPSKRKGSGRKKGTKRAVEAVTELMAGG